MDGLTSALSQDGAVLAEIPFKLHRYASSIVLVYVVHFKGNKIGDIVNGSLLTITPLNISIL